MKKTILLSVLLLSITIAVFGQKISNKIEEDKWSKNFIIDTLFVKGKYFLLDHF